MKRERRGEERERERALLEEERAVLQLRISETLMLLESFWFGVSLSVEALRYSFSIGNPLSQQNQDHFRRRIHPGQEVRFQTF